MGRGSLAQDKLHTHACWDTQAPCSPSGLAEQGHIHLLRNSPRASHDCFGRHLSVSWGRFQSMHCSTAGTGSHAHLGACETRMKSAVPWLYPDQGSCSCSPAPRTGNSSFIASPSRFRKYTENISGTEIIRCAPTRGISLPKRNLFFPSECFPDIIA